MARLVYGLVDPRDGRLRYVGKTTGPLARRVRAHAAEARAVSKRTHRLCWLRALDALGLAPEAVVLEAGHASGEALDEAERFFIAYFRGLGCELVNLTPGGDGQPRGYQPSAETREKMRAAMLGKNRHPRSLEQREAIRRALTGRATPPEVRAKQSAALKGRARDAEAARKGGLARRRPVLDLSTGATFGSVAEAGLALGVDPKRITKVLRGRAKTCAGRRFAYASPPGGRPAA